MNKTHLVSILSILCTMLLLSWSGAAQAEPCGGITYSDGLIKTGQVLPTTLPLADSANACLIEIAKGLLARPAFRTVTVAARLPNADRLEGKGLELVQTYTEMLIAGGVPLTRISAVVPSSGSVKTGSIKIAFTEKMAMAPVAQVEGVNGDVKLGASPESLTPAVGGGQLPVNTIVVTGPDGRVGLGLADGSRIQLSPDSTLLIGSLHLNKELRRVVQLDLLTGEIEVLASSGGDGSSFNVKTRVGIAGVRGTEFRVAVDSTGEEMRVDTLGGAVSLQLPPDKSTPQVKEVMVNAGFSASAMGGELSAPRALLGAPMITEPLLGKWNANKPLVWSKGAEGTKYKVYLARDADFIQAVRVEDSAKEKFSIPTGLGAGKWFWRVTPVDALGRPGMPSKVYAFSLGD